MERLTKKIDYEYMHGYLSVKASKGDAINKLGKLEDIMEKYGIESPEDLEKRLIEYGAI